MKEGWVKGCLEAGLYFLVWIIRRYGSFFWQVFSDRRFRVKLNIIFIKVYLSFIQRLLGFLQIFFLLEWRLGFRVTDYFLNNERILLYGFFSFRILEEGEEGRFQNQVILFFLVSGDGVELLKRLEFYRELDIF